MTIINPGIETHSVSICLLPNRGMIPPILSFHIAIANQYRYSKLILVYDDALEFHNGIFAVNDNEVEIQHVHYLEDAFSVASQLDFLCNLMIWDNDISDALNPATWLGSTLGKMTSFYDKSAFIFFPDSWVGISYPSAAQKTFIYDHAIDLDRCLQIHLIESLFVAKEYQKVGISVYVASADYVRISLLVCKQLFDRLVRAANTSSRNLDSKISLKCLFLVMRAWHSNTFHDGLYSFGCERSIKSVIETILSSLHHAGMTLEDFDKIVVCADSRTKHLYGDDELMHELSAYAPSRIQNLSEHVGSIIPQELTLDYVLPALLELHDSTVYSFDSNAPVPFYLANIGFKSIIGAPVETLLGQNANQIQIDYVAENIKRLTLYSNTDRYCVYHANTFASIQPRELAEPTHSCRSIQ